MQSILFLAVMNGGAWGGSEELWYQSALRAAQEGLTVAVCCFDWPEKKARFEKLEQSGCKLYRLPGKPFTKRHFLGQLKLKKALAAVPFEKYDLAIVSQGGWKEVAHPPFRELYKRLHKYVLIYHNYNADAPYSSQRANSLQEWVDHADKNMGDSSKIFEAIKTCYRISVPNQVQFLNPLTFSIPEHFSPYPGLQEGNYIFSVFAALDVERKAQDVLINAFSNSHWRARNWKLRLYGDGQDKEMLQQLINKNELQSHITLCGKAADYPQAIRETHVVLQLTHIDAMPITVMDALAIGRPLIVSNVGDMTLWVLPAKNGWICDTVTAEAIETGLTRAWENRGQWEAMGKASFTIFQQRFPKDPVRYFLTQAGVSMPGQASTLLTD